MDSNKLELELEKSRVFSSLNRVSHSPSHPLELLLDSHSKKLKILLDFFQIYLEKTWFFLFLLEWTKWNLQLPLDFYGWQLCDGAITELPAPSIFGVEFALAQC